jgi:hypothetical protein
MKYTYSIRCEIPSLSTPSCICWNPFIQYASLGYCKGYLDASRKESPRLRLQIVRSDDKIIEELAPDDVLYVGQYAGKPTAEQYERAAQKALDTAKQIREHEEKHERRTR